MKYVALQDTELIVNSRSREGAWIEINKNGNICHVCCVAPARERGLKSRIKKMLAIGWVVAPARERGLKFGRA